VNACINIAIQKWSKGIITAPLLLWFVFIIITIIITATTTTMIFLSMASIPWTAIVAD
jgi:hypothetical protein